MVNKWDITYCTLDPTQGSEQKGKRPVLIISNDAVNHALTVSTVLPFSSVNSGDKIYPTEVLLTTDVTALPKDSVVMVQQIRTIVHSRLDSRTSFLADPDSRERVLNAIRLYFEV